MRTVGEALIAKMESQTLTLSSSSHSSNKKNKKKQTKMMRQQSRKSYQEEDKKKEQDLTCPTKSVDLNNKLMNS